MENDVLHQNATDTRPTVISAETLLTHWQEHRRLTRKTILAFPEDKLFTYSLGGMRPFAELAMEMLHMSAPGIRGVVSGKWQTWEATLQEFPKPESRADLLQLWDNATEEINSLWPQIPLKRFQQVDSFFGLYTGPIYWSIWYLIDNEIHHRGQGYVYLRSLGIAPPPFWERD